MERNKIFSGTITTNTYQPNDVTGDHLTQATSIKPVVSIRGGLQELEEKLRQCIQHLEAAGETDPEFELFRTKLTRFYTETTSPDLLADILLQHKVLNTYQRDRIKNEALYYEKNLLLYNFVLKKREVFQLMAALKKSGNEHVLQIIEGLVFEYQNKYEIGNDSTSSVDKDAHLPQASSIAPLSLTGGLQELEKKLRQKIKYLEADGEEDPEYELFRKKLPMFYIETTSPDVLADHLFQNKVLSRFQKEKIRNERLVYEKNVILYDIIMRKREFFQLLGVLKKTGNEHVLKIIEDLVLEN